MIISVKRFFLPVQGLEGFFFFSDSNVRPPILAYNDVDNFRASYTSAVLKLGLIIFLQVSDYLLKLCSPTAQMRATLVCVEMAQPAKCEGSMCER